MAGDELGGKEGPQGHQGKEAIRERRPAVAPGKVPLTARLQRGNAGRRPSVPGVEFGATNRPPGPSMARSSAELADDPYMDMAHRGLTALAERGQGVVQARQEPGNRQGAAHRATGRVNGNGRTATGGSQEPLLRMAGIPADALTPQAARRLAAMLQALMGVENGMQPAGQQGEDAAAPFGDLPARGVQHLTRQETQQRGGRYNTLSSLVTQYTLAMDGDQLAVDLRYDVATSELVAMLVYEVGGQTGSGAIRKPIAPLVIDDILLTPLSIFHLFAPAEPARELRAPAVRTISGDLGTLSDSNDSGDGDASEGAGTEGEESEGVASARHAGVPAQRQPDGLDELRAVKHWMESSIAQSWSELKVKAGALWDGLEAQYDGLLDVMRREGGVPGEYLATYLDFRRDFLKGFVAAGYETIEGLVTLGYNAAALLSASEWLLDPERNLQRLDTLGGVIGALLTEEGWALMWEELKRPFVESWQAGDYGEAIGRGAFELVDVLLGSKGATKLGKLGKLGKLRVLGKLGQLGKLSVKGIGGWMRHQAQQLGKTLRGWLDELTGKADTRPPPPTPHPEGPKARRARLEGTPAEIYQRLMGQGARASFPRYAKMLHDHGLASPEDVQKASARIRKATPDIELDELAKKLKEEFEPRVLGHLRELPPDKSYQRMRELTDGLHPKDKGTLAESWYHQTHAPGARREVWVSKADMESQGIELTSTTGRRIDILDSGVITEVKSGAGKLQARELEQFADYVELVTKRATIGGVTARALRYAFTNPQGALKNLPWMRRMLMTRRLTKTLEFQVFNESGATRFVRTLQDLHGLDAWLMQ